MKKNNLKKQFGRLFTVLAIAGTFVLAAAAQTKSDKKELTPPLRHCNLRSITGNYGLNITGAFVLSPTATALLVSVGQYSFDGAGSFSGSGTTSMNGDVGFGTSSGTYTVENNCTGTLTVTFSNGFVITNNIVIVDEGKEIYIIQTTPGTVISGVAKRQ